MQQYFIQALSQNGEYSTETIPINMPKISTETKIDDIVKISKSSVIRNENGTFV